MGVSRVFCFVLLYLVILTSSADSSADSSDIINGDNSADCMTDPNSADETMVARILFGSCNKPYAKQPLWKPMITLDPDLFIWTGDIVYHDRPNVTFSEAMNHYYFNLSDKDPSKQENIMRQGRLGKRPKFQWNKLGFKSRVSDDSLWKYFYAIQLANQNYSSFVRHMTNARNCGHHKHQTKQSSFKYQRHKQIIGIWDDHDYGINNGDGTYLTPDLKWKSKRLLFDFLERSNPIQVRNPSWIEPESEYDIEQGTRDARRQAYWGDRWKRDGVYAINSFKIDFEFEDGHGSSKNSIIRRQKTFFCAESRMYQCIRNGNNTLQSNKDSKHRTMIIDIYLTDDRWFQNDPEYGERSLLGNQQWDWMEKWIQKRQSSVNSRPDMVLFVSGIQVLPWYRGLVAETWSNFNQDRVKLLKDMIYKYRIQNPLLISGDVHFGGLMRYDLKQSLNTQAHLQSERPFSIWRPELSYQWLLGYIYDCIAVWNWTWHWLTSYHITDEVYREMYNELGYLPSIYELTSSGLTHSWGETYPKIMNFLKWLEYWLNTDQMNLEETRLLNFGEIEVRLSDSNGNNNNDEQSTRFEMVLRLRGKENNILFEKSIPLIFDDDNEKRTRKTSDQIMNELMYDDFIAPYWRSVSWLKIVLLSALLINALTSFIFTVFLFPIIIAHQIWIKMFSNSKQTRFNQNVNQVIRQQQQGSSSQQSNIQQRNRNIVNQVNNAQSNLRKRR